MHIQSREEQKQRLVAISRMARLPEGVAAIAAPAAEGACHVCGEEEEADDNLLLQCDACRVFVHQRCYGVAAAPDGRLWLCDVCAIGTAPQQTCTQLFRVEV